EFFNENDFFEESIDEIVHKVQNITLKDDEKDEITFSKTKQNKLKLVYQNEEYIFEKAYSGKNYWRCVVHKPIQCRARIHTNLENTKIIHFSDNHFHEPEPDILTCKLVATAIKERAKATTEKPRTVIPFVPVRDVIYVFKELSCTAPAEIKDIFGYFEKNYIGLIKEKESSLRSVPPFPIQTWNVFDRVIKNLPRSNNSLEAWHRSLSQDILSHPVVNKCIKQFIRE
ncbi:unnamed protein product, partial [Brachionus calyciflorus]